MKILTILLALVLASCNGGRSPGHIIPTGVFLVPTVEPTRISE